MTLAEIAEQAKEGDRFQYLNGADCYFNAVGEIHKVGSEILVILRKQHLISTDWHFTYRANHCPHCGKPIEGR